MGSEREDNEICAGLGSTQGWVRPALIPPVLTELFSLTLISSLSLAHFSGSQMSVSAYHHNCSIWNFVGCVCVCVSVK